jgi:thiol-disulfide isomerase/thioredoxin
MRLIPIISAVLACTMLLADDPVVPRRAPEFVLTFPGGQQKLLSSFKGKVVMIEFLHTTCPHCQHASQVFSKLYTEYGSRGFQPIGVAWNDMSNMLVPDFVRDFNVNYPVAYSDRATVLNYLGFSPMMRTVVPQIIWIDRKGMIRSQTPALGDEKLLNEAYWRQEIETLLAETDSGAKKTGAHHASVQKPN